MKNDRTVVGAAVIYRNVCSFLTVTTKHGSKQLREPV